MSIRNLDAIFRPRSVAVIGASNKPGSVGNTLVANLTSGGFAGEVFPINPKHAEILGRHAYPNIAAVPIVPDLAIVSVPAAHVPAVVRECGERGVRGLVIITAGFREVGAAGRELEAAVQREATRFEGLRIIGPNCLGVIAPAQHLNASFAAGMPPPGRVAFLSQSGALCTAVLDWALERNVGFSAFVSLGNMLDVGMADLIDYFADDPNTEALLLYIESLTQAREFMSAARAFSRHKPIIAYKAGRFAESAKAAASHTGALAGVDAVYDAAFHRAGIERVFSVDEMFDTVELLCRQTAPRGQRLAIVSNAGGPGVMATDVLMELHGSLATLTEATLGKLNAALPAHWSHGNPVDVLGDAPPERYSAALDAVLADEDVDAGIVILTPQSMTDPTRTAQLVATVPRHRKPLLAAWMGGALVQGGRQILHQAGIPTYSSPEQAVRAFQHMVSYTQRRELLLETPREVPLVWPAERTTIRQRLLNAVADASRVGHSDANGTGHVMLSEDESKALLAAYGIPVTLPRRVTSCEEAVRVAQEIGHPVVMKILSPDITHKTDVGGVELNLTNDAEVRAAYERMLASVRSKQPQAHIDGVTLQPMVTAARGVELLLGVKQDPVFGSVLLAGAGGITAELLQDRALELPPLNERLAQRMLESLRCWPLLSGYRGRPGVNVDRVVEILLRLSTLVADWPEVVELDVNPLLVTSDRAIALDARVALQTPTRQTPNARPFAHLAIRPYPEEFVREIELPSHIGAMGELKAASSQRVRIRPVRPEDEPLWRDLIRSCSEQTLRMRFHYLFRDVTHEMAARYCFVDYDREIALVAEIEAAGQSKLIGVVRLVADADLDTAEYAVLVADAWQGHGLGTLLTDDCLQVARRWGVKQIVAETTPDNALMLSIFQERGFDLEERLADGVVIARKTLSR